MNSVVDSHLATAVSVASDLLTKQYGSDHQRRSLSIDSTDSDGVNLSLIQVSRKSKNVRMPTVNKKDSNTDNNDTSISSTYDNHKPRQDCSDEFVTMAIETNPISMVNKVKIDNQSTTILPTKNDDNGRNEDSNNNDEHVNNIADKQNNTIVATIITDVYSRLKAGGNGCGSRSSGRSRKSYQCTLCNELFNQSSKLKLHMLLHTGERAFKCPFPDCAWSFNTNYKLRRHIRGHTGEKPYKCSIEGCEKFFTTAYNLKTHIRGHYKAKTYECKVEGCTESFPSSQKLKIHERKCHSNRSKLYKCGFDGCGKEFNAMNNLNLHSRSHSTAKIHSCTFEGCYKQFTKASKLSIHMRSHTGERPFKCSAEGCGWSFTSPYKLKRHQIKHTGARPYQCTVEGCNKAFTRSSHLKAHMLVHTGDKPYKCSVPGCDKAFTASSSLNVHRRKHTGEKPYKCSSHGCPKAYTAGANLRLHQRRDHGIVMIPSQSQEIQNNSASLGYADIDQLVVDHNSSEVERSDYEPFSPSDFNPADVSALRAALNENFSNNEDEESANGDRSVPCKDNGDIERSRELNNRNVVSSDGYTDQVTDFMRNHSNTTGVAFSDFEPVSATNTIDNPSIIKSQSGSGNYCSRTSIIRSSINRTNYRDFGNTQHILNHHEEPGENAIEESQGITSDEMLNTLSQENENLTYHRSQNAHLSYTPGEATLATFHTTDEIENADGILLLGAHQQQPTAVGNDNSQQFNIESVSYGCDGEDEDHRFPATSTVNLQDI